MGKDKEVWRMALGYQAMKLERQTWARSQRTLSALLEGLNVFW